MGVRTISSIFISIYICILVLVQRTCFYYVANKRSVYRRIRARKIEVNDDEHSLFYGVENW